LAPLFARFLVLAPFAADFAFLPDVGFAFLRPLDVEVDADDDLAGFFFDGRSDVVALTADRSAFIGVPLRNSSPIVSAVLATGLFPRADCSPTIVPAMPPAIAPTGPPTIPPSTAPVTPPTACLGTEMFLSDEALDEERLVLFWDFLAMVLSLDVLNLNSFDHSHLGTSGGGVFPRISAAPTAIQIWYDLSHWFAGNRVFICIAC
jgi:hypothetical protein